MRQIVSALAVRRLMFFLAAFLLVHGWADRASADVRIVARESGGADLVTMMKGGMVAIDIGDGVRMLRACANDRLAFVNSASGGIYWEGTLNELNEGLSQRIEQVFEEAGVGEADWMALMGLGLAQEVDVRVTRGEQVEVNGYETTYYLVEYRSGDGPWKTVEETWMSRELLEVVKEEVGDCYRQSYEIIGEIGNLMGLGMVEAAAVMTHPNYLDLYNQGVAVRSRSRLELLGIVTEVEMQIVEVTRDPLPDELFQIPEGYRRVDNPLAVFTGEL
ncbi:MAG: hypothetical protein H0Z37_01060 [Firmicutes bacterium]|nr:hypothetical protein [Bacillota bacterium]